MQNTVWAMTRFVSPLCIPMLEKKISVAMAVTISGTTSGMVMRPMESALPLNDVPRSSAREAGMAMATERIVADTATMTLL